MREKHEDPFTRKERRAERKFAKKRDRSKYKKTDFHKRAKALEEEIKEKLSKKEELFRGRVLSIRPEEISVEYKGKVYACTLRGLLKKEKGHTSLLAVGDFVLFEKQKEGLYPIHYIEERKSILSRREHFLTHKEQIVAANIDQVLVTFAAKDPLLDVTTMEKYLLAAKKGGMEPVIVINKIDLLGEKERKVLGEILLTYLNLGYVVLPLSATSLEGMEALKLKMGGKASVFTGPSGVGKSSLINVVTGLSLPTKEITKKTRKGTHATTQAHLVPLSFGGWCVDTPGIGSFGVWKLSREELDHHFSEIFERGKECKFPNCTHTHEPECAVKESVSRGTIAPLRFKAYLALLKEVSPPF